MTESKVIDRQRNFKKRKQCWSSAWRNLMKYKVIVFNAVFTLSALAVAEYVVHDRNGTLYHNILYYTIYFSSFSFWALITQAITWIIVNIGWIIAYDSWSLLYVRDIKNRIYVTILSFGWLIIAHIFRKYIEHEFDPNITLIILCIFISSVAILVSFISIRHLAITSYFEIYAKRASLLEAHFSGQRNSGDLKDLKTSLKKWTSFIFLTVYRGLSRGSSHVQHDLLKDLPLKILKDLKKK